MLSQAQQIAKSTYFERKPLAFSFFRPFLCSSLGYLLFFINQHDKISELPYYLAEQLR